MIGLSNPVKREGVAEGVVMTPSSYHALLFNIKSEQGLYKTEEVPCFCGSNNYKKMMNKDRYGMRYTLCLCLDCGILYANPRLTEESLKMFYETDYRDIYSDRGEIANQQNDFYGDMRIKDKVTEILNELEEPMPKVVFEIGCGNGSNLLPFKDCEILGVDYDAEIIKKGIESGLNLKFGGIDILEAYGKKADLIIMNHVIEHFTDLEKSLLRIRELLSDKGVLYVSCPGLYNWVVSSLFQNAHNYQFNGDTISYVMRVCGFEEHYLTDEIESIWFKSKFMDKSCKDSEQHKFVDSYLSGDKFLLPNIRVNCKFSATELRDNIVSTVKRGTPYLTELINKHPNSDGILICGGPSTDGYVDKIKSLQISGAKVYAIERMYQWCLNHDIIPDYVIALDASDDVAEAFKISHNDTSHILVAQCKPKVFDLLDGKKIYTFFLDQRGINYKKILEGIDPKSVTFINAGSSVSLCAMSVAMTLGARNLHIFGFDCHITDRDYANGITGVGCINNVIEIEIGDRTFKTTTAYFSFMQQFFQIYLSGQNNGLLKKVKLYGDSMVKEAALIDIDGDKEI
jgi:SAM-dependent methyltransferase